MEVLTLRVLGTGGHANALAEAALLSGERQQVRFVDDRWPQFESVFGNPVIGRLASLGSLTVKVDASIEAVGNNALRQKWQAALMDAGISLATLGDFAHLGVGVNVTGGLQIERRAWLQFSCSAGYGAAVGEGSGCYARPDLDGRALRSMYG